MHFFVIKIGYSYEKKKFLRVSKALIMILQLKLKNQKWRIRYNGHFGLDSMLFVQIAQK